MSEAKETYRIECDPCGVAWSSAMGKTCPRCTLTGTATPGPVPTEGSFHELPPKAGRLAIREAEHVTRQRSIDVEIVIADNGASEVVAHVWQTSRPDGTFGSEGPRVSFGLGAIKVTRGRWEDMKHAIDRAWDRFEGRWPSP